MDHDLSTSLDGLRPVARPDFVAELAARLEQPARRHRELHVPRPNPRLVAAGAATASLVAGLAAVGGASAAVSAVSHAVHVATHAAPKAPAVAQAAVEVRGLSSGGDQYVPGYGFGDPNHNHEGPPGVHRKGGDNAPPLESRPTGDGKAKVAGTTVSFDEQAHLWISVIDESGTPILLTQRSKRGSTNIGGLGVAGPQTKFIQYVVRIPRPIDFQLRVPENLLASGEVYRIRIVAIDPQGNKSTLRIPFRA